MGDVGGSEIKPASESPWIGILMKFIFRVLRALVLTIFLAGSLLGQGSVLLVGGGRLDRSRVAAH